MSGVAFLDTETTGLDPDRHQIWEVGLIVPDPHEVVVPGGGIETRAYSEHLWHLPVDLSRADPSSLAMSGFHDRYTRAKLFSIKDRLGGGIRGEFVGPDVFAQAFVRLTRGLHLCGAVVSFDAERLWKLLRANGECPMWHYHLIDVETLAVGWLRGNRAGRLASPIKAGPLPWPPIVEADLPWKSEDLSRAVGVDPDEFDRHTALGDARWARAIFRAVMGPDA